VIDGEEIADAALMANAKKDGKIVYYGTWPPNAAASVQAAFKKTTGIEVEYLRLTTQALYPRVTAEFAANKLQADFIDMTDLILVQDAEAVRPSGSTAWLDASGAARLFHIRDGSEADLNLAKKLDEPLDNLQPEQPPENLGKWIEWWGKAANVPV
jgi:hypothetical protein